MRADSDHFHPIQDHHRAGLLDLDGQAAVAHPDGAAAQRALPAVPQRLQAGAARSQVRILLFRPE